MLPSGEPGQVPPTATLSRMKNGWLKTHGFPLVSAGVCRSYWMPSMEKVTESGVQSTAYVWNASASAAPFGSVYDPVALICVSQLVSKSQ